MFSTRVLSFALSIFVAGCAVEVGATQKDDVDVATDDALIQASEGAADSATRPSLLGEITNDSSLNAQFSRTKKYIAFWFDAEEGDEITLETVARRPADLDTVLILYNATSSGRPQGASLAVNDDINESNVLSRIVYRATDTRRYVAVVRRYDRGTSGSFALSLNMAPRQSGAGCGGHLGATCSAEEYCDYAVTDSCGDSDEVGACESTPSDCPSSLRPVCGCDGVTYDNACQAHLEGVTVARDGACAARCPATGIRCTPECPGTGRLSGGVPCRRGNYNAETCSCDPIPDCRTTGCGNGEHCVTCSGGRVCFPDGIACS